MVNAGASTTGTISLRNPAPPGGATIQLASADPLRLTVPGVVSIAAGQQTATFDVTGVREGLVRMTATAASGAVGSQTRYVSVALPAADATITTDQLIEQARLAGTISDELAFVYLVYAAFGAPELPANYRGRAADRIDGPVRLEINARWNSLSASARAAILPFTMPPIYAGSWGDIGGGSAFAQPAVAPLSAPMVPSAQSTDAEHPCHIPPLPRLLPGWGRNVTEHFYVWYRTEKPRWGTLDEAARAAGNVSAVVEESMRALPPSCNGSRCRMERPAATAATPGWMSMSTA